MIPRRKRLFTPGPLNSSERVLQAAQRNIGSREPEFIETVSRIRSRLLSAAGLSPDDGYEAVLMQGSGTFGIESAIGTLVPRDGKLLILVNGAYGRRMVQISERLGIDAEIQESAETAPPDLDRLARRIAEEPTITTVAAVACETTTGILNPVDGIGTIVRNAGKRFLVDAMSSFGGHPIDIPASGIDGLISSANKCLEGIPGFSFVLVKRDWLSASANNARSLSLDLHGQWVELERSGQFRFTPPTQAILAFDAALDEFEAEGGVPGRVRRYRENHDVLIAGMAALGFQPVLEPSLQSHIITAFLYPEDPAFDFEMLYEALADRDLIIYPGKLARIDCFRIGTIGQLYPGDFQELLEEIETILIRRGLTLPLR